MTKQGGVVVWVVGDQTIDGSETGTSFRQALEFMELGFKLWDTMIYRRSSIPLNHRRYQQYFEYMFVFSKNVPATFNPIKIPKKYHDERKTKGTHRHRNKGIKIGHTAPWLKDTIKENIWNIPASGGHSTKDKFAHQHPAIFPEALARDHILSWSDPGDMVLDPMCGSGTTLKMAKELGRKWLGFDIAKEYVKLSRRRVVNAKTPLFNL